MSTKQLHQVVSSGRARGALKNLGVTRPGQLGNLNLSTLIEEKGIGVATVNEIQAFLDEQGPNPRREADAVENAQFEENMDPVTIGSPNPRQAIIVMPGDRVQLKNGANRIIPGVIIQCESGVGHLTAKMWFTRKYERDTVAVEEALKRREPWRLDAVEWLKNRKRHGLDYSVLPD
jgi:hypothetical protein